MRCATLAPCATESRPASSPTAKLDGDDVRVVTFANGMVARETLVSSDDQQRRLVYAIMDQQFKNYSASVQVFRKPSGSRLVWLIDLLPNDLADHVKQMTEHAMVTMKKTLEFFFMNGFLGQALGAGGPARDRADKMALYGQFVGSWDLDVVEYRDDGTTRRRPGEWHFGWALEGRAVQDVWIVPPCGQRDGDTVAQSNRYGTTLRVYDPGIDAWHVAGASRSDKST